VGEWSEYFEDFPEENPANWVNGRFDPQGAAALRAQEVRDQAAAAKVAKETQVLRNTIARMIEEGKARARSA
jgi:hypothetical protein